MTILDIAIGLVFTYLILSLTCTATTELIAQWLNSRAITLREGIWTLLTGQSDMPSGFKRLVRFANKSSATNKTTANNEFAAAKQAVNTAETALGTRAGAVFATYKAQLGALVSAESAAAIAAGEAAAAEKDIRRATDALNAFVLRGDAAAQANAQIALNSATAAATSKRQADASAKTALQTARAAVAASEAALKQSVPTEFTALSTAQAQLRRAHAAWLVHEFYGHPIIAGLAQRRVSWFRRIQLPSYIPAREFSTVLTDLISSADANGPLSLGQLREATSALPNQIRKPLQLFIDQSAGDVERFRNLLEQWYADAMERVSGLYKRKSQVVTLLMALWISVCTAADTVRITRVLAANAAIREAIVARAQAFVSSPAALVAEYVARDAAPADPDAKPTAGTTPTAGSPNGNAGSTTPPVPNAGVPGKQESQQAAGKGDTNKQAAATPPVDTLKAQKLDSLMKKEIATLQSIGIPLGWNITKLESAAIDSAKWVVPKVKAYWTVYEPRISSALPGLLLTTLAISLGAPFWFDVLNKIINIRGAGRAPEEKPKSPEALPPPRGA